VKTTGWILDVYVEGEKAITWLRAADGTHLKLHDEYNPSFYVLPKTGLENEVLNP
jgi:hypothetical protein